MCASEEQALQEALREKNTEICDLQRSLATALCAKGDSDRALARERVQRQRAQQRERAALEEVRCLIWLVTDACFLPPPPPLRPDWLAMHGSAPAGRNRLMLSLQVAEHARRAAGAQAGVAQKLLDRKVGDLYQQRIRSIGLESTVQQLRARAAEADRARGEEQAAQQARSDAALAELARGHRAELAQLEARGAEAAAAQQARSDAALAELARSHRAELAALQSRLAGAAAESAQLQRRLDAAAAQERTRTPAFEVVFQVLDRQRAAAGAEVRAA
jgi:hypothetical protein